ncbi:hypothetical protein [Anaeromyxobacter terrae]|uniref:hypothetical protein n=1 Tax=Anaeromyxobacter terrae TaxID=2925406 RepID=UPI001F570D9E|nr:hypothetical protein [Anaeromyxobacter sp. SG22]
MRRRRWLTVPGLGMAGLLVALPAYANGANAPARAGAVKKLDRARGEIKLAGSGGTLKVTEDTQILKDGQRGTFSDVREGDEVRASYSGSGDTEAVKKLEVTTGPDAPLPGSVTDQAWYLQGG